MTSRLRRLVDLFSLSGVIFIMLSACHFNITAFVVPGAVSTHKLTTKTGDLKLVTEIMRFLFIKLFYFIIATVM